MIAQQTLTHLPERFPLACQWEITCRCNLRCVMCYTDCFNQPEQVRKELTTDEILRIIEELAEAGCVELALTGGEPLARPDFIQIYEHAKAGGLLVTVFTNGTLITREIADRFAALPPCLIEISLHGLGKDSFEQITQGHGSYERCMAGIRLILERRLPLTLKTTGMTVNRDEILKIKACVEDLGQHYQTKIWYKFGSDIRPRLDESEDVYEYQLGKQDVIAIEQADREFRAEREKQGRQEAEPLGQGSSLCGGGQYRFHIDAYGQLQLCSKNRRQSYDLRQGSFTEGFHKYLSGFPCPWKLESPSALIQPSAHHV
jgi:MoaA/NifB/PqqE/SkfB family radical SAM enzyme